MEQELLLLHVFLTGTELTYIESSRHEQEFLRGGRRRSHCSNYRQKSRIGDALPMLGDDMLHEISSDMSRRRVTV